MTRSVPPTSANVKDSGLARRLEHITEEKQVLGIHKSPVNQSSRFSDSLVRSTPIDGNKIADTSIQNRKKNRKLLITEKTLRRHHIQILMLIKSELNDDEITRKMGLSRSTVSEHLKNLRDSGWAEREFKDVFSQHRLTKRAENLVSEILAGYDLKPNQIRAHNLVFKCSITRKPASLEQDLEKSNWIMSYPNNWRAYRKRLRDANMMFSQRNVTIYLFDQYGATPDIAFSKAVAKALEIKDFLEQEYPGLVLGEPLKTCSLEKGHFAFQGEEIAKICERLKTGFEGERLQIDHSHGVPELETIHPQHGLNDARIVSEFLKNTDQFLVVVSEVENLKCRVSELENVLRLATYSNSRESARS